MRQITPKDKVLMVAENALRTLLGGYQVTQRASPVADEPAPSELTSEEKRLSAGLMRINHCGEVCAQALYQGQALTAELPDVRKKMEQAAAEENDHLEWCAGRLHQLGTHTTLFSPAWYAGSFAIGAIAGAIGDRWSLGFVAETEYQVVSHLESHLARLPENDQTSRRILEQMKVDELSHATNALDAGGAQLPAPIKQLMHLMGRVMTSTVYYV